jgi:hypothetical protein
LVDINSIYHSRIKIRENVGRPRKRLGLFRRWVAKPVGGEDALDAPSLDAPYIDIGPNEVDAYVVHLKDERGMADSSHKNHLAVSRSFFQTVSERMKLPGPTTRLGEARLHQRAPSAAS